MALTDSTMLTFADAPADSATASYIVVNGAQLYAGGYVGIVSGSGNVSNISDTAGMEPLGFSVDEVLGDTSVSGNEARAIVKIGGGLLKDVTVVGVANQTDVGELVYVTDNNTFTLTPTSNIPAVGVVDGWVTGTTCHVRFFPYSVMRNS
jgi:hypothetical protein